MKFYKLLAEATSDDLFRKFDTLEYVGTKLNMRYYADEDGKTHFADAIAGFNRNQ